MIVLLRFHVYSTFYGHLSNKVTQQMVAHKSSTKKYKKKNANAKNAFTKLDLAPLLASAAETY